MVFPCLSIAFAVLSSLQTFAADTRVLSDYKVCTDEECSMWVYKVKARQDFVAPDCRYLSFKKDTVLYVYHLLSGIREDLWAGTEGYEFGYFPKDSLEVIEENSKERHRLPAQITDFMCVPRANENSKEEFEDSSENYLLGNDEVNEQPIVEGKNVLESSPFLDQAASTHHTVQGERVETEDLSLKTPKVVRQDTQSKLVGSEIDAMTDDETKSDVVWQPFQHLVPEKHSDESVLVTDQKMVHTANQDPLDVAGEVLKPDYFPVDQTQKEMFQEVPEGLNPRNDLFEVTPERKERINDGDNPKERESNDLGVKEDNDLKSNGKFLPNKDILKSSASNNSALPSTTKHEKFTETGHYGATESEENKLSKLAAHSIKTFDEIGAEAKLFPNENINDGLETKDVIKDVFSENKLRDFDLDAVQEVESVSTMDGVHDSLIQSQEKAVEDGNTGQALTRHKEIYNTIQNSDSLPIESEIKPGGNGNNRLKFKQRDFRDPSAFIGQSDGDGLLMYNGKEVPQIEGMLSNVHQELTHPLKPDTSVSNVEVASLDEGKHLENEFSDNLSQLGLSDPDNAKSHFINMTDSAELEQSEGSSPKNDGSSELITSPVQLKTNNYTASPLETSHTFDSRSTATGEAGLLSPGKLSTYLVDDFDGIVSEYEDTKEVTDVSDVTYKIETTMKELTGTQDDADVHQSTSSSQLIDTGGIDKIAGAILTQENTDEEDVISDKSATRVAKATVLTSEHHNVDASDIMLKVPESDALYIKQENIHSTQEILDGSHSSLSTHTIFSEKDEKVIDTPGTIDNNQLELLESNALLEEEGKGMNGKLKAHPEHHELPYVTEGGIVTQEWSKQEVSGGGRKQTEQTNPKIDVDETVRSERQFGDGETKIKVDDEQIDKTSEQNKVLPIETPGPTEDWVTDSVNYHKDDKEQVRSDIAKHFHSKTSFEAETKGSDRRADGQIVTLNDDAIKAVTYKRDLEDDTKKPEDIGRKNKNGPMQIPVDYAAYENRLENPVKGDEKELSKNIEHPKQIAITHDSMIPTKDPEETTKDNLVEETDQKTMERSESLESASPDKDFPSRLESKDEIDSEKVNTDEAKRGKISDDVPTGRIENNIGTGRSQQPGISEDLLKVTVSDVYKEESVNLKPLISADPHNVGSHFLEIDDLLQEDEDGSSIWMEDEEHPKQIAITHDSMIPSKDPEKTAKDNLMEETDQKTMERSESLESASADKDFPSRLESKDEIYSEKVNMDEAKPGKISEDVPTGMIENKIRTGRSQQPGISEDLLKVTVGDVYNEESVNLKPLLSADPHHVGSHFMEIDDLLQEDEDEDGSSIWMEDEEHPKQIAITHDSMIPPPLISADPHNVGSHFLEIDDLLQEDEDGSSLWMEDVAHPKQIAITHDSTIPSEDAEETAKDKFSTVEEEFDVLTDEGDEAEVNLRDNNTTAGTPNVSLEKFEKNDEMPRKPKVTETLSLGHSNKLEQTDSDFVEENELKEKKIQAVEEVQENTLIWEEHAKEEFEFDKKLEGDDNDEVPKKDKSTDEHFGKQFELDNGKVHLGEEREQHVQGKDGSAEAMQEQLESHRVEQQLSISGDVQEVYQAHEQNGMIFKEAANLQISDVRENQEMLVNEQINEGVAVAEEENVGLGEGKEVVWNAMENVETNIQEDVEEEMKYLRKESFNDFDVLEEDKQLGKRLEEVTAKKVSDDQMVPKKLDAVANADLLKINNSWNSDKTIVSKVESSEGREHVELADNLHNLPEGNNDFAQSKKSPITTEDLDEKDENDVDEEIFAIEENAFELLEDENAIAAKVAEDFSDRHTHNDAAQEQNKHSSGESNRNDSSEEETSLENKLKNVSQRASLDHTDSNDHGIAPEANSIDADDGERQHVNLSEPHPINPEAVESEPDVQISLLGAYLTEDKVSRLQEQLGKTNMLLLNQKLHKMDREFAKAKVSAVSSGHNVEEVLDAVLSKHVTQLLAWLQDLLDFLANERQHESEDASDDEMDMIGDINEVVLILREKHSLRMESTPLAQGASLKSSIGTKVLPTNLSIPEPIIWLDSFLMTTMKSFLMSVLPAAWSSDCVLINNHIMSLAAIGPASLICFFFLWRSIILMKSKIYRGKEMKNSEYIKSIMNKKSELAEELDNRKKQLIESEKTMGKVLQKWQQSSDGLAKLKAEQQNLEIQVAQQQKEEEELRSAITSNREHRKQQEVLKGQVQECVCCLKQEMDSLMAQVTQAEEVVQNVERENTNSAKDCKRMKKAKANFQCRKAEVQEELNQCRRRCTELSSQLCLVQKQQAELQETVNLKESEVEGTSNCLDQLKQLRMHFESNEELEPKKQRRKFQEMMDITKLNVLLKIMEQEAEDSKTNYSNEVSAIRRLEAVLENYESKHAVLACDRDKLTNSIRICQQKLNIMSEMYQEKEMTLQKKVTQEEYARQEKELKLSETDKKVLNALEEVNNYKSKVDSLKEEFVKTERSYKDQVAENEKMVHENWLKAREAEREGMTAKRELARLRERVVEMEAKLSRCYETPTPKGSALAPYGTPRDPNTVGYMVSSSSSSFWF
uniref:SH3 domain-containing protein n=1 Tax=Eptatretus burgeri TaxID=7764 RepID=A0A8C4R3P6_EPTBU